MEKEQRSKLQKATQDARRLLEEEFSRQLLETYDINVAAGRWSEEPGAHLQAVDLRYGLHLAHRLREHRRQLGVGGRILLQQTGHALQVVLDAVVHFLDQHLALRDGGLQPRLVGGALLGHVAGHDQQLRRRAPAR